jgi:hypothetical protein
MQNAVVSAGRSCIHVTALDENAVNAPQGQVARNPRAGDAAADNQNLSLQCHQSFP